MNETIRFASFFDFLPLFAIFVTKFVGKQAPVSRNWG